MISMVGVPSHAKFPLEMLNMGLAARPASALCMEELLSGLAARLLPVCLVGRLESEMLLC